MDTTKVVSLTAAAAVVAAPAAAASGAVCGVWGLPTGPSAAGGGAEGVPGLLAGPGPLRDPALPVAAVGVLRSTCGCAAGLLLLLLVVPAAVPGPWVAGQVAVMVGGCRGHTPLMVPAGCLKMSHSMSVNLRHLTLAAPTHMDTVVSTMVSINSS